MEINGFSCTFHHLGIPTTLERPGERYSPLFDLYTSDAECSTMRIQWHRFGPHCSLHPLIQSVPHVAFKVDCLHRAVVGYTILLGPFEPIPGFQVAMIEDRGHPIELIETTLTDEQIWGKAVTESILYQDVAKQQGREKLA